METSDDGDRDWGAHVKESEAPLDKVKQYFSQLLTELPCQDKYTVHNITVVRIAEYINTVVGRRKTSQDRSAVVMKLDVEVRIQQHPFFKNSIQYQGTGVGGPGRSDPQWGSPAP